MLRWTTARAVLVVIVLWSVATMMGDARCLPGPWTVGRSFVESAWSTRLLAAQGLGSSGVLSNVGQTLVRATLGLVCGMGASVVVGRIVADRLIARTVALALVIPWRVVPPLLVVPIVVALAGSSYHIHVLGVAGYVAVSLLPFLLEKLELPNVARDLVSVHGADPAWAFWCVRLPAAIPDLLGHMRLVTSFGLGITIIFEYLAAPDGLGRVMKIATNYASLELLLVCVIWSIILGFAYDTLIVVVFGRFARRAPRS